MGDAVPGSAVNEDTKGRHARRCICCGNQNLERSSAVLMPFLAKRVFDHEPVEIAAEWGLRDLRSGMAYSLCSTLECLDCGVIFLDYRFSDTELSRLYKDYRGTEYNALRVRFEPGYAATATTYQGRAAYLDAVESILAPYLPARPAVLDWGGDTGVNTLFRFSASMLHVYDISGVEPCAEATRVSLEVCHATAYDLVTCSQVLEHVSYPIEMLAAIRAVLRPHSLLYLEVPLEDIFRQATSGYARGTQKRHWHEHVNFFSPFSLQAMAHACDLQVVASQTLPISLGWRESEVQMMICKLP